METVGARAMAHDMNQRIIMDDEALPHFAWASQNIDAATALLHGLPRPATLEDHRAHHEIRMLSRRCEVDASQCTPSD